MEFKRHQFCKWCGFLFSGLPKETVDMQQPLMHETINFQDHPLSSKHSKEIILPSSLFLHELSSLTVLWLFAKKPAGVSGCNRLIIC